MTEYVLDAYPVAQLRSALKSVLAAINLQRARSQESLTECMRFHPLQLISSINGLVTLSPYS